MQEQNTLSSTDLSPDNIEIIKTERAPIDELQVSPHPGDLD